MIHERVRKIIVHRAVICHSLDVGMEQKRFNLRSKSELVLVLEIVEGFYAETVAGAEKRFRPSIP